MTAICSRWACIQTRHC